MTLPQPRYPHQPGTTRLAYSPDGKFILSTGDMFVRRFVVGDFRDEPLTVDITGAGTSIAASRDFFVVSTDDGLVTSYKLDGEKCAILERAALPIRQVEFSPDGTFVAAAGDNRVSITLVDNAEVKRRLPIALSTPKVPVKHITWHPAGQLLATSALDGVVRIWEMKHDDEADAELIHELDSVLPTIRQPEDIRTTAAAWAPDGVRIAVPNKTFAVVIYSIKNWIETVRLADGHVNGITDIQWSANGRYIATAALDDRIVIWDVSTQKPIQKYDGCAGVCAVRWHPHSNELTATTSQGTMYQIEQVLPEGALPSFGDPVFEGLSAASQAAESMLERKRQLMARLAENEESDDDLFVEQDTGHELNEDQGSPLNTSDLEIQPPSKRSKIHTNLRSLSKKVEPFQSGSTPWMGGKRYLCMNIVGSVWTLLQDDEHNSVTVEFFNQDQNRELHFADPDKFDLAALGPRAVLLANSRTGKVSLRFHASFSENWERTFNGGVRSVALSDKVVIVCLNNGITRTFSTTGAPLMISRASRDPVVTCAAYESLVMIVRAAAQGLVYSLEDAITGQYWQKDDSLDVGPTDKLHALFFSENGDPCIMDNTGVLSTLTQARVPGQARWVPLFDSAEAAQENQRTYWPLAVFGTKLLCIVLKGQQQYPPLPLPLPDEVDLCVPGYGGPSIENLEASYMLGKTLYTQERSQAELLLEACDGDETKRAELEDELEGKELELDKLLLRLFQESCQDKRLNRAFDMALLLRQRESVEAAGKIAVYFGLHTLADKVIETIQI